MAQDWDIGGSLRRAIAQTRLTSIKIPVIRQNLFITWSILSIDLLVSRSSSRYSLWKLPNQRQGLKAFKISCNYLQIINYYFTDVSFVLRTHHSLNGRPKLTTRILTVLPFLKNKMIFIIKSCWQHRVPWHSLAIRSYQLSPLVALLGCISDCRKLVCVSPCWSANNGASMWRSSSENVAYGLVFTSPTVSRMSCSSYFDGLWDRRWVAIQLLFCGVLFPKFLQKSTWYFYVVPI